MDENSVTSRLPWLVLERLAGTDPGAVICCLTSCQLDLIAFNVPEEAPHSTWSQVLDAHLDRSVRRVAAARLFDPTRVDPVRHIVAECRDRLDRIKPIELLHHTATKNVIVTPEGNILRDRRCG